MRSSRAALVWASAALFCLLPAWLTAYSGGPPVRRTGAPGDRSCLDASCHAGPRFDDSPAIHFEPEGGFTYVPGAGRQRWRVRIEDPRARAYGLQLTVRSVEDLRRKPAGDLTAVEPATSVICEDDRFKGIQSCLPTAPLQFFHHTEARLRNEFQVDWQPPATGMGDAVVYMAANASEAGQRSARIHHRAFLIRQQGGPSAVNGASQREGISAGAWVTIFGSDFSGSGEWTTRINDLPAEIGYRDERQMNVLAPAEDKREGLVMVEVRRDAEPHTRVMAWKRRLAPAFFPASLSGAAPGDRVTLYATGLGASLELRFDGRAVAVERGQSSPGVESLTWIMPEGPPGSYRVGGTTEGVPIDGSPVVARLSPDKR